MKIVFLVIEHEQNKSEPYAVYTTLASAEETVKAVKPLAFKAGRDITYSIEKLALHTN
jgi:hypothetical protein